MVKKLCAWARAQFRHLSRNDQVFPAYRRLAMGDTHAVDILLAIPLTSIGQFLTSIGQTPHFYLSVDSGPDQAAPGQAGLCRACVGTVPHRAKPGPCRTVSA